MKFIVIENRGCGIIYDYLVCESERAANTVAASMNINAENPENGLINGDGNLFNYYVEQR
ncbi:MAG: hypothetical protein WC827_04035 [Candidatus Paceibacterota bacterium]|jgi:hypothetical protein